MDDEKDVSGRFRLPETFSQSDDPVDGNPYPHNHPAHDVWADATHRAEAEISQINADAAASLTPDTAHDWMQRLVIAKFSTWAERGVQTVWTDEALRAYERWLVEYANVWIESVSRYFLSHPPPFDADAVLTDLRNRLGAQVQHWKTEARRYRLRQEAHAAAAVEGEIGRPVSAALVERRRRLVAKYRDDHDLDAVGFARHVGISDSGIRAIVREDANRFTRVTQDRLLNAIGTTREDWYRE
jgi:hypothetical protein